MSDAINNNFHASVKMTEFETQSFYPLELMENRVTALMNLKPDDNFEDIAEITSHGNDIELLLLKGQISCNGVVYDRGGYLRLPTTTDIRLDTDCTLFIKYNQFLKGDDGERSIDTQLADKWLPGPVDGIEIRPLHVFDTESIMLLRWYHTAEFRPKLNPRGEEILVIDGLLQNRDHIYRPHNWIRNPIEDWRRWHGNSGTIIYYKSGHFPDDPIREDI